MPFGIGVAMIMSGSMEPELSVGDLLIIAKRDSYYDRDIIVYQDGRIAVTHRIVSITVDEVITRGDANNTDDNPITVDQIKGKLVLSIPLVRYVVSAIKSPLGTLVFLHSHFSFLRAHSAPRSARI